MRSTRPRTPMPVAGVGALAACFALYAFFGWRIAQGTFLEHWNLLFDLDAGAYKTLLTGPWPALAEDAFGALKHPLFIWLRPVAEPWLRLGLEEAQAACMSVALISTLAVLVFWHGLRVAGAGRIDATLAAALFALGASQLFNGFLVDSYPFATLSILIVVYCGFRRFGVPGALPVAFAASAVAAFGVTVTNAAVAGILDIAGRLHAARARLQGPQRWAAWRRLAFEQGRFAAVCGGIALVLILLTWWGPLTAAAGDPIGALKRLYWTQTKGEVTAFSTVLLTFFGYAFVAPDFTAVALPEHVMLDFRAYAMSLAGAVALPLWLVFWCGLAGAALWVRQTRIYALALAGCILFNLLLHSGYQFRFSIFLYTPHSWPLIALMAGLGLAAVGIRLPRLVGPLRAGLAVLILLAAANNLPRAWQAATAFDHYPPESPFHQTTEPPTES